MGRIFVDLLDQILFPATIVSSDTDITLDTLALDDHRSFEWRVTIEDETDAKFVVRKVLALYDENPDVRHTIFGRLGDPSLDIVLTVIKDGTDMKLKLTNNTGNELKITIVRLGKKVT